MVGSYDPHVDNVQIDGEKAKAWIEKGVQPSPTVHNILVGQKVIDGKKVNPLPRKSPIVKEAEAGGEPAAEVAPAEESTTPATETTESATEEPKEEVETTEEDNKSTEETAEEEKPAA